VRHQGRLCPCAEERTLGSDAAAAREPEARPSSGHRVPGMSSRLR